MTAKTYTAADWLAALHDDDEPAPVPVHAAPRPRRAAAGWQLAIAYGAMHTGAITAVAGIAGGEQLALLALILHAGITVGALAVLTPIAAWRRRVRS